MRRVDVATDDNRDDMNPEKTGQGNAAPENTAPEDITTEYAEPETELGAEEDATEAAMRAHADEVESGEAQKTLGEQVKGLTTKTYDDESEAQKARREELDQKEKTPVYKMGLGRKFAVMLIFVLLLVLVAFVVWAVVDENTEDEEETVAIEDTGEGTVSVPAADTHVDHTEGLADVCSDFSSVDLECAVSEEVSESVPRGNLISQSSSAGSVMAAGSEVSLLYSRGPAESSFPAVEDREQSSVESDLYKMGVTISDVEYVSDSDFPEGRVIEAERDGEALEEDDTVENGDEVVLMVSDGTMDVPDWSGEMRADVLEEIESSGISVRWVSEESEEDEGTVLSQDAVGNISNDEVVELTVAESRSNVEREVPDVLGDSLSEAQASLAEAGFRNIYSVEVESDMVDDPVVTQVAPGVGSDVLSENNVVLIVSIPED